MFSNTKVIFGDIDNFTNLMKKKHFFISFTRIYIGYYKNIQDVNIYETYLES